VAQVSEKNENT